VPDFDRHLIDMPDDTKPIKFSHVDIEKERGTNGNWVPVIFRDTFVIFINKKQPFSEIIQKYID
jgi:hypothetical protein